MQLDIKGIWKSYALTKNPEIKEKLLVHYLPIVKYVASRMLMTLPSSVEYDDLVSSGLLGLIGSVDRFDPEQGVKFETYVLPRIKGAILDELRTLDWAPRSLRSKARSMERTIVELERELCRSVSDIEVADRMDITDQEFSSLQRDITTASLLSLDGSLREDTENGTCMYDVVENPMAESPLSIIENEELKELMVEVINEMPEQERLVIALYYYEELTLREIGNVMEITESRVSQIHTKAIGNLKTKLMDEVVSS
ncbi:MAG: FliA/WhiG family RNA polymerase sigma factor [Candidatus Zhuqueibacterota bacterium]